MRIIFDSGNGEPLNGTLNEMHGDLQEGLRPLSIDFMDLPFGYNENNFKRAVIYHIDVSKPKSAPVSERIVITQWIESVPTPEETIKALEDQLLLQENEKVGGLL